MATVRTIDVNTKINYATTREFFRTLAESDNTLLANPLRVKGDNRKIAAVYTAAMCEYMFHLSRIPRNENIDMFDSHSNIEIRKTYIKQIAEFAKVFPATSFDGFNVIGQ